MSIVKFTRNDEFDCEATRVLGFAFDEAVRRLAETGDDDAATRILLAGLVIELFPTAESDGGRLAERALAVLVQSRCFAGQRRRLA
jgi:hypothetical protein